MALSFTADIRPLFRDTDVETMKRFGLDLSSYNQVKDKAAEIYATIDNGSMPCDEPWPKDKVALFKRWMMKACELESRLILTGYVTAFGLAYPTTEVPIRVSIQSATAALGCVA